ncbi:hypothetical protein LMG920_11750, partial [Xanthomonas vesicatoria]
MRRGAGNQSWFGETSGMRVRRRLARAHAVVTVPSPRVSMSPFSIVLIGFAMSTDAFAAAIGKG